MKRPPSFLVVAVLLLLLRARVPLTRLTMLNCSGGARDGETQKRLLLRRAPKQPRGTVSEEAHGS